MQNQILQLRLQLLLLLSGVVCAIATRGRAGAVAPRPTSPSSQPSQQQGRLAQQPAQPEFLQRLISLFGGSPESSRSSGRSSSRTRGGDSGGQLLEDAPGSWTTDQLHAPSKRRNLGDKNESLRRGKLGTCNNGTVLNGIFNGTKRSAPLCGSLPLPGEARIFCEAHRFRLPPPHADKILCVPQKNGNRDLGLLMHLMHFGELPTDLVEMVESLADVDFTPVASTDDIYFVARNPYSRLLSLYLDKVLRCHRAGGCDHDLLQRSGAWSGAAVPTFPEFVSWVDREAGGRSEDGPFGALCSVDHHLCSQVSGCLFNGAASVQVLRIEEESLWFACLAARLELSDAELMGRHWHRWKGRSCFYSPDDLCHPTIRVHLYGGLSEEDEEEGEEKHGHSLFATNASLKIAEYYTPAAARVVSRLYAEDLQILDYPTWDGVSAFFATRIAETIAKPEKPGGTAIPRLLAAGSLLVTITAVVVRKRRRRNARL